MPQFSIVITCFNHREFIADAIRSALNQTLPAKEIIVVDDGSTDGSQQVLDQFADSITVVKNPTNVGANPARNVGAYIATGDYLVFLDGDDLFRREALAVYNHLAQGKNPVLILSLLTFFDHTLPDMSIPKGAPIEFVDYPRLLLKDRKYASSASAIVVRRTAFVAAGGWTEVFPCEDTDLFLRVGHMGPAIHILSPPTALKRAHASNYSRNVLIMTSGIFKVIAGEYAGKYKRKESLHARYSFIGGPAVFWIKKCLSIGAPGTSLKLALLSWPMIIAAVLHKSAAKLGRASTVQRTDLPNNAAAASTE